MNLLLDTHLLLWAAADSPRLSRRARKLIETPDNQLWFSVASLWEIAIKSQLGRTDFKVNPRELRRGLLAHGYDEMAVEGEHVIAVSDLPPIHKDPFDRILIAQARIECLAFLTADGQLAEYKAPVRLV